MCVITEHILSHHGKYIQWNKGILMIEKIRSINVLLPCLRVDEKV